MKNTTIFIFLIFAFTKNICSQNIVKFDNGSVFIEYNLDAKSFDAYLESKQFLKNAFVEYKTTSVIRASNFTSAIIEIAEIVDDFGTGKRYDIIMTEGQLDTLKHSIYLYDGLSFFLSEIQVENTLTEVESNYMSPLRSETAINFLGSGDNRVLFAPYDNGDYDYYNAFTFGSSSASNLNSHEISAFYNSQNGEGLIIGSVAHDTWKTGVQSYTATNGDLIDLKVYGGAVSKYDKLPHGKIKGNTIKSPKIFVGYFEDWRNGLGLSPTNKYYIKEAFSKENTFSEGTMSVSVPPKDAKVFKIYNPLVDANGDILIPLNNFILSGSTPTCANVNNGKITINNTSSYIFDVIISGPNGFNKTFQNTLGSNEFEITGLASGEYMITFIISANPETLFEGYVVNIDKASSVSGKLISTDKSSKTAIYKVSGDKKYTVLVNNLYQTTVDFSNTNGHNITVQLSKGNNAIKIIPENTCRGSVENNVNLGGLIRIYPNPTTKSIHIQGLDQDTITAQLFDIRGQLIRQKKIKTSDTTIYFSIDDQSAGMYFIKIISKTSTDSFKIIKE